jgi:putative oxidoreductase
MSLDGNPASALRQLAELGGRCLLAGLFLISGLNKVGSYAAIAAYMEGFGVSTSLLPLVIATEVIGATAIMIGWQTRVIAFLLAGYTLLTAVIFHTHFADQIQAVTFLKNFSIAGGLLLLVANGAGRLSLDSRLSRRV